MYVETLHSLTAVTAAASVNCRLVPWGTKAFFNESKFTNKQLNSLHTIIKRNGVFKLIQQHSIYHHISLL